MSSHRHHEDVHAVADGHAERNGIAVEYLDALGIGDAVAITDFNADFNANTLGLQDLDGHALTNTDANSEPITDFNADTLGIGDSELDRNADT